MFVRAEVPWDGDAVEGDESPDRKLNLSQCTCPHTQSHLGHLKTSRGCLLQRNVSNLTYHSLANV